MAKPKKPGPKKTKKLACGGCTRPLDLAKPNPGCVAEALASCLLDRGNRRDDVLNFLLDADEVSQAWDAVIGPALDQLETDWI